jgi:hypothetical protein
MSDYCEDEEMMQLRYNRYVAKIGLRQKLVKEEYQRLCKLNINSRIRLILILT